MTPLNSADIGVDMDAKALARLPHYGEATVAVVAAEAELMNREYKYRARAAAIESGAVRPADDIECVGIRDGRVEWAGSEECERCDGRGYVGRRDCADCDGTGKTDGVEARFETDLEGRDARAL